MIGEEELPLERVEAIYQTCLHYKIHGSHVGLWPDMGEVRKLAREVLERRILDHALETKP